MWTRKRTPRRPRTRLRSRNESRYRRRRWSGRPGVAIAGTKSARIGTAVPTTGARSLSSPLRSKNKKTNKVQCLRSIALDYYHCILLLDLKRGFIHNSPNKIVPYYYWDTITDAQSLTSLRKKGNISGSTGPRESGKSYPLDLVSFCSSSQSFTA